MVSGEGGNKGWFSIVSLFTPVTMQPLTSTHLHTNTPRPPANNRLRSGVMGVLFRASLLSRSTDAAGACAGDINTLMAVDAGRLANLALSVQELWSLPLQIIAAMTLLYLQVSLCYLAGEMSLGTGGGVWCACTTVIVGWG